MDNPKLYCYLKMLFADVKFRSNYQIKTLHKWIGPLALSLFFLSSLSTHVLILQHIMYKEREVAGEKRKRKSGIKGKSRPCEWGGREEKKKENWNWKASWMKREEGKKEIKKGKKMKKEEKEIKDNYVNLADDDVSKRSKFFNFKKWGKTISDFEIGSIIQLYLCWCIYSSS